MQFGILGPLEVLHDGEPVDIPGAKQRAVLAALLVHAGEVLSVDRLAEILWGDDQPSNPKNALQSQVSQLRRALGPEGRDVIVSRPTGYLLQTPADAIDARRFEALLRGGREAATAGDHATAARLLREALDLWRGTALAEFADQPFAEATISRLDELRLGATEDRIDADLAAGRHAELVPELEALVAEHPLRERLRGQLMLALYRCGRQADALHVYHDAREMLDDELGLDPSPQLTRRYQELLRQEDDTPTATTPRPVTSPSATPPSATSAPTAIAGVSASTTSAPDASTSPPGTAASTGPQLRSVGPPAPLSSFVGRDDELARILEMVRGARLVTLTGPGGVGKTRLATEAAMALQDDPVTRDGMWFVELATVTEPDLLADEVAATLGLHDDGGAAQPGLGPGRGPAERLADALRHRRALLVLDNCEHLVDATAAFARALLTAAPQLTVLCTTREALGVTGETVWSVPSLALPPDPVRDPERLLEWGAPRMFVERIRGLDPAFVLDDTSVATIADVCRRLDGIPLALELAAARVRTLGLDELARRLDDRFRILTGGDRTAQPRQRTLRAVVEWSWELLDERERALYRRLSVFSTGASLEAIEAVCGGDERLPTDEVLDVLSALVDKSVVVLDISTRRPRYRMLETLRAYGEERLEAMGETATTRDRHADRMLEFARRRLPDLRGHDQIAAMREADVAAPDLRTALQWLEVSDDVVRGAQLATELGWYWYLKGTRHEAVRWLSRFENSPMPRDAAVARIWRAFLSLGFGPNEPLRAVIDDAAETLLEHGEARDIALSQLVAADVAAVLGERDRQDVHLARARTAAAQAGDDGYAATADFVVGHGFMARGRYLDAEPWMEAAYERFVAVGDRWGQVQCLMALLTAAEASGDLTATTARARRGLELATELGLREMEGVLHSQSARVHALAGDFDAARRSIERLRVVADELGSDLIAANVDLACGIVALREDDLDGAERSFRQLLSRLDRMPHGSIRGEMLGRLGVIAELRGDLAEARRLHAEAIEVTRRFQEPRSTAYTLEAAAATLAAAGEAEDAVVLLGAADARRRSVGLPLPDVDRIDVDRAEASARAHLDDHAFDAAFARGAELPDDRLPVPATDTAAVPQT